MIVINMKHIRCILLLLRLLCRNCKITWEDTILEALVIIPCHNEEISVQSVITDIKRFLPKGKILVIDNASTDRTAQKAIESGVDVYYQPMIGKGNAVLSGFRLAKHRVIIMVDGDSTYDVSIIPEMLARIQRGADMVVASRSAIGRQSFPFLHVLGNKFFSSLQRYFFSNQIQDSFSGFRAFSSSFVGSYFGTAKQFDIETELNIHAYLIRAKVENITCEYRPRLTGSHSKLSTFKDGFLILAKTISLLKRWRPNVFYNSLTLPLFASSLILLMRPLRDWLNYDYVFRTPSLIVGSSLLLLSFLLTLFGSISGRLVEAEKLAIQIKYSDLERSAK